MTTFEPALANRIAVEAPIPDEAPVMRARCQWADPGSLEDGRTGLADEFGSVEDGHCSVLVVYSGSCGSG